MLEEAYFALSVSPLLLVAALRCCSGIVFPGLMAMASPSVTVVDLRFFWPQDCQVLVLWKRLSAWLRTDRGCIPIAGGVISTETLKTRMTQGREQLQQTAIQIDRLERMCCRQRLGSNLSDSMKAALIGARGGKCLRRCSRQ